MVPALNLCTHAHYCFISSSNSSSFLFILVCLSSCNSDSSQCFILSLSSLSSSSSLPLAGHGAPVTVIGHVHIGGGAFPRGRCVFFFFATSWPEVAVAIWFIRDFTNSCRSTPHLTQLNDLDDIICDSFAPTGIFEHALRNIEFFFFGTGVSPFSIFC